MKKILVVGGAGFIGSHVNKLLNNAGYSTLVLDNLSSGKEQAVVRGEFIKGDLADSALLDSIFKSHKILAVMHFAAHIDVGESVLNPYKYYQNNVANSLNLLYAMIKHHIKVFIFSSTAAIFGLPKTALIDESHPKEPINPYGKSKLMVEEILKDFDQAYQLKFSCLRYFNAAGGDPEGEIKNYKTMESNLIPIVLEQLISGQTITIYGKDYPTQDGTCIRDYIHLSDLASAHISAMEHLIHGGPSTYYNLGNGLGFSVKEVIDTACQVTGIKPNIIIGNRRLGDPPVLIADSKKACEELAWVPQYPDLSTMIEHAFLGRNK